MTRMLSFMTLVVSRTSMLTACPVPAAGGQGSHRPGPGEVGSWRWRSGRRSAESGL